MHYPRLHYTLRRLTTTTLTTAGTAAPHYATRTSLITLHYTSNARHCITLHELELPPQLQLQLRLRLQLGELHHTHTYTTLSTIHYAILRPTPAHSIPFHDTTLHYIQLHNATAPLQYPVPHCFTLHYAQLHYPTPHLQLQLRVQLRLQLRYFYTTLRYPRPHLIAPLYIALSYTRSIRTSTIQVRIHYGNYTPPQLQLRYITTTAVLHHTIASSCG